MRRGRGGGPRYAAPHSGFKIAQRSDRPDSRSHEVATTSHPSGKDVSGVRILGRGEHEVDVKSGTGVESRHAKRSEERERHHPKSSPEVPLPASVRFLEDAMHLSESLHELLSDTNTSYHVIGAIGPQGAGKSTFLSMLAGNDPMDLYRQYVFRPCSREAVESCRYQTLKIYIYISKTRTILLDCQAMSSASILDDMVRANRRAAGNSKSDELFDAENLRLLLFMFEICHTLVLNVDWFVDMSVIRELMSAQLISSALTRNDRKVNLVVAHQRAKTMDFNPVSVKRRAQCLRGMFEHSKFNVCGGLSMGNMGFKKYENIEPDVNYVLLSDIKPRIRGEAVTQNIGQELVPMEPIEYGTVMNTLRTHILKLPKPLFASSTSILTEKEWFQMASLFWTKIENDAMIRSSKRLWNVYPEKEEIRIIKRTGT